MTMVCSSAAADSAPKNADWYCTQGAELIQAGQRYSEHSSPLQWDPNLLIRARLTYIHCRDLSDPGSDNKREAFVGISLTDFDVAQMYLDAALFEYLSGDKEPATTFKDMRNQALWYARDGLAILNDLETNAWQSADVESAEAISKNAQYLQDLKNKILNLTIDNVPRNKAELGAFLSAHPEYMQYSSATKNWGIPQSIVCRRDEQSASVVSQAVPDYSSVQVAQVGATTVVTVDVGADGKAISVHLATSSGNEAVDEAALKAAYASTYKAGSFRCKPVEGTVKLIFHYQ